MAAKGNKRGLRLLKSHERYVMRDGETLKIPSLVGNVPRFSGRRTGGDKEFLRGNKGLLSILQHKMS